MAVSNRQERIAALIKWADSVEFRVEVVAASSEFYECGYFEAKKRFGGYSFGEEICGAVWLLIIKEAQKRWAVTDDTARSYAKMVINALPSIKTVQEHTFKKIEEDKLEALLVEAYDGIRKATHSDWVKLADVEKKYPNFYTCDKVLQRIIDRREAEINSDGAFRIVPFGIRL